MKKKINLNHTLKKIELCEITKKKNIIKLQNIYMNNKNSKKYIKIPELIFRLNVKNLNRTNWYMYGNLELILLINHNKN